MARQLTQEILERDIQEYLAKGGKITRVETVVREPRKEPSREHWKRIKHSEIKRRK